MGSLAHLPAGSVRWLPVEAVSDVSEIARMGVTARYRGEGLSLQLLKAVIYRALAADIKELQLGVRTEQARVVDLYAAYGFELAPELGYGHANPDELPPMVMRRWL